MRRLPKVLVVLTLSLTIIASTFLWQPLSRANSLYQVLTQVLDTIQREYWKDIEPKTLVQGALQGIVDALGDRYSYYIPAEYYGSILSQVMGTLPGIGAVIEPASDGAKIVQLYRASPALLAGMEVGDVITAVDGRPVKGLGMPQVRSQLDGEASTQVRVSYYRTYPTDSRTALLTRKWVSPPSATWTIHEGYGYIKIREFGEHLAADVRDATEALKDTPGLIVDLRNCPGGSIQSLTDVSQYLIRRGTIGLVESRGLRQPLLSPGPGPSKPLIALVNSRTASAAEILAAGIQHNGGYLVGEVTYGKGMAQRWRDLGPELGGIVYTVGNYLTIQGAAIDGRGLTPNMIVQNTFQAMPQIAQPISEHATLRLGARSSDVLRLQRGLKALGFYSGELTGLYDANTANAVSQFQESEGLAADGVAAAEDLRLLNQRLYVPPRERDVQLERAIWWLRNPPPRSGS